MCKDHFDLPKDMENYMEYHVMGLVSQVRMKPGCMPTKFDCQPDRKSRTPNTTERPFIIKKRRLMTIKECEKEFGESSVIQHPKSENISIVNAGSQVIDEHQHNVIQTADKSIQAHIFPKFRSKTIQTKIKYFNQAFPPIKNCSLYSVGTSPLKVEISYNTKPSKCNFKNVIENYIRKNSLTVIFPIHVQ
ncbi:unnamed protein product [Euphydryas editha]|uniref:Uncharacterized protein n=1 Tax=Euphydryas editha TaxID=104508 RepID=A0AAU9UNC2_EUPED|nr:unnamed protein product [Euphydryas editha]